MLDLLFELAKLVHKTSNLGHSIVMLKNTVESASTILIFILLISVFASKLGQKHLNLLVVCDIIGKKVGTILDHMVHTSLTH